MALWIFFKKLLWIRKHENRVEKSSGWESQENTLKCRNFFRRNGGGEGCDITRSNPIEAKGLWYITIIAYFQICAHTPPDSRFPNPVPIPLALELRRCVCFPLVVAWRVNKRIHQSNARKRTQKWQYERGGGEAEAWAFQVMGMGMRNPNQKPKPTPKPIPKHKPKPKLKPKATSKRAPKSVFNMHVRHVFLTQEKWMKFLSYIYRALPRGAECERNEMK